MNTLMRLYPRAWRERYGDELVALLEEHPATLADLVDLMRGAFDARLHPQVPGASAPDKEMPMSQRLFALMAAAGGVLWMAGIAAWLTAPLTAVGDRDSASAMPMTALGIALMGIAIGELGTRPGNASSRTMGHVIAGTSVLFAVLLPLPYVLNQTDAAWGFIVLSLFGFPVVAMLGAGRGRMNGVIPTWLAVVIGVGAVTAWVGFGGSTPDSAKWVALLFGLAFILLGGQALTTARRSLEPVTS